MGLKAQRVEDTILVAWSCLNRVANQISTSFQISTFSKQQYTTNMTSTLKRPLTEDDDDIEPTGATSGSDTNEEEPTAGPSRTKKPSTKKPIKRKKPEAPSPGIIYISRLPPGMTPQKVRHLMARWGEVGKVYAQPRDGLSLP